MLTPEKVLIALLLAALLFPLNGFTLLLRLIVILLSFSLYFYYILKKFSRQWAIFNKNLVKIFIFYIKKFKKSLDFFLEKRYN